jgi:presequence protease
MDSRNPELKKGDILHQFEIIRQEAIPKLQVVYYELVHRTHGSRMVHLSSDDRNSVFMVTFPTHPENSTGVAHILEHSVLEGSRKYPVKIYKNLSGRSLNTFLNAMTSSDYTAYPFATCNKKDYFNLMDVYMDASFFPLLDKNTFLQEGWRYDFSEPGNFDSRLDYRGVVYNEMKGAMSNPVRLFYEGIKKALFPDLTYANASGGNPADIPELSYEEWKEFHTTFYHPSNAFFFTFGNIPLSELTEKIHTKVMTQFEPSKPVDPIPEQTSYEAPRRIRMTYPVSQSEPVINKAFLATMWKLVPVTDFQENLRLELLCQILAGDSSSVLNRTLLGSGLGKGLAPAGFDTSFSESIFGAGLKDVDEADADAIESLIIETLENAAETGFDESEINAAIHELEFGALEIRGDHGIPFGLLMLLRGMKLFLEGGDFAAVLKIHDVLDTLRKEALQPGFFRELLKKYFLDNPHRVTMILAPEAGGMERLEADRRKKLDAVRSDLTEEEKKQILKQMEILEKHQKDDGDTSCLPSIERDDISPLPEKIPQSKTMFNNVPVFRHAIPTNGVTYLHFNFRHPMNRNIPVEALKFTAILPELGAAGRSYVEMNRLLKTHTGGVSLNASVVRDSRQQYWISLQADGRCLPRNHKAMVDLMADIISDPELDNTVRIQELLNMNKSYAVPMAAQQGHRMAMYAAGRKLSLLRKINHETSGLAGVKTLVNMKPDEIPALGTSLKTFLMDYCRTEVENIGLTGLNEAMNDATRYFPDFHSRLCASGSVSQTDETVSMTPRTLEPEAWVFSTDVSYVAQAFPAVCYEHPDAPVLMVLSNLMEKPMYGKIRAQGGAYGAFASYDSNAGIYTMMTYRDPHTAQSLDAFNDVIKRLASGEFTAENLHHAIVNVISNLDTPPSPREKGLIAFKRQLAGVSYEMIKNFREGILNTSKDDIIRVLNTYLIHPEHTGIAMVTSDKILENSETRPLNLVRKTIEEQL